MYTGVLACSLPNFSLEAWEVTAGGLKKQKLQTKAPFYERRQADGTWQAASGRRLAGACVSAILGLKKKKKCLWVPGRLESACCQTPQTNVALASGVFVL